MPTCKRCGRNMAVEEWGIWPKRGLCIIAQSNETKEWVKGCQYEQGDKVDKEMSRRILRGGVRP